MENINSTTNIFFWAVSYKGWGEWLLRSLIILGFVTILTLIRFGWKVDFGSLATSIAVADAEAEFQTARKR